MLHIVGCEPQQDKYGTPGGIPYATPHSTQWYVIWLHCIISYCPEIILMHANVLLGAQTSM